MFGFSVPKAHTPEHAKFLRELVSALKEAETPAPSAPTTPAQPRDSVVTGHVFAPELALDLTGLKATLRLERQRSEERRAAENQAAEMNFALRMEKRRAYSLFADPDLGPLMAVR